MLNRVELIGNLGQDPEMRESRAGAAIANLRIATTHRAKSQEGDWEERTEWHTVVAFGNLADNVGKYLSKGRQVFVEGRLQTRKWEDKNGNTRYSTEVVANEIKFLGKRDEDGGRPRSRPQQDNGNSNEQSAPRKRPEPQQEEKNWDEEIPF
jgi:single-strand DNA-binding protein